MDAIKWIADTIIQYAPEIFFLEMLYYVFLGISILFIFRLLLHLIIRLISWKETSTQPFKLRVDKDYDFVNGWRKKPKDSDSEDD